MLLASKLYAISDILNAFHTFSRDLKSNVNTNFSITRIGLNKNFKKTKKLFFKQHSLMKM